MKRLGLIVMVIALGWALLAVRPAHAGRNCLSAVGLGPCIAACISNQHQACAAQPDPQLCAQNVSQFIQGYILLLANTPLGESCDGVTAVVRGYCGCSQ